MEILKKYSCVSLLLLLVLKGAGQTFSLAEIKDWEGRAQRVEIIRDKWGVPHCYGEKDEDAVFGMVYAQCEDDYWGIEQNFIGRIGRRALYLGEENLMRDLYSSLFIDSAMAAQAYLRLPRYYQGLLDAHAAALNFYLYKNPAKAKYIKRYEPWMQLMGAGPMSNAAPGYAGVGLSNEAVTNYLVSREVGAAGKGGMVSAASGRRPAGFYQRALDEASLELANTGSNAWGIGPSKTTSGHAFLLINPHASISVHDLRLEVQMSSKEGLNVYGAPFMGDLIVWNGFNENAGWAHTVQYSDQADLYKIRFDDAKNPLAYHYGKGHRMAEEREITVKYKKDSTIREKTFKILFTSLGPVVGTVDGVPVALKDSFDIVNYFIENWDMHKVKDFSGFQKIISLVASKPNTFGYADKQGTIAFWHSNSIPKRNAFYDWSMPIEEPGPDAEWQGIHTPEETPHVVNPKSGYFLNSNSDPWILSGASSPDSLRFPAYMSYDPRSLRSVRGDRLLRNDKKFSFADFEKITLRDYYLVRFEILFPSLFDLYEHCSRDSLRAALAGPIAVLKKWDFYADTNSVATTLSIMLEQRLSDLYNRKLHPFNTAKERYAYEFTKATDFPGDTALLFLKGVTDELKKDFGTWEIPWGKVNRLQRISPWGEHKEFNDSLPSFAVISAPNPAGSINDYQSFRTAKTKLRYGTKGNTFVAVVDFGDKLKARTILANGESADPSSPHYTDQAQLYATGQLKDAFFYKEDVLKHMEVRYHPGNLKK